MPLKISSPVFKNGESIPSKFTCEGENINPPLEISGVEKNAKSLVLIMTDPDIPEFVKQKRGIEIFDHWILFNLPPNVKMIGVGQIPGGSIVGANSIGENKYAGPCPPDREHRYFFKLYALKEMLKLREGSTRVQVEMAMEGKIISQAELMGVYEKHQSN